MSDLNGIDAFDNVLDRLLSQKERSDQFERSNAEAEREARGLRDQVRRLEQRLQSASADAMHYRALVPADVLTADDEKRRRTPAAAPSLQSDDIPF